MGASKIVLKILSICVSLLIFLLVVLGIWNLGRAAYDMGYRLFTEKPVESAPGRDVVMEITGDMGPREIGKRMEEKRLVDNGSLAALQIFLFSGESELQPGLYTLNTSQTVKEMLAVMAAASQKDETEEDAKTD